MKFLKSKSVISAFFLSVAIFSFFVVPGIPRAEGQVLGDAERAKLEQELAKLEEEIKKQESILAGQKTKSASLERDVAILQSQINSAKAKIKARDLEISKLGGEINTKVEEITRLSTSIDRGRNSLSELLRQTYEFDQKTFPELILSGDNLSEFYSDIEQVTQVKQDLYGHVLDIQGKKVDTELAKVELQDKRNEEVDKKKKSRDRSN